MSEESPQGKTSYSFEEYKEKFYPASSKEKKTEGESPYDLGVKLAEESLKRLREKRDR